jgi:hypothetical protein
MLASVLRRALCCNASKQIGELTKGRHRPEMYACLRRFSSFHLQGSEKGVKDGMYAHCIARYMSRTHIPENICVMSRTLPYSLTASSKQGSTKDGRYGVLFYGEVGSGGSWGQRPSRMGMVGLPFSVSDVVRGGREGMV